MHAVRLSGFVTAAVFFVWLTATGVQLSFSAKGPTPDGGGNQTTIAGGADQNSQLANVISSVPDNSGSGAMGVSSGNNLVVATSTQ